MSKDIKRTDSCKADITIVVPCYNSEKTLGRCLDSLLAQTIPVKIIVVNDGSKDGTQALAESYAKSNPNIHVHTQENAGQPQARKAGLILSDTKSTAFVDSDDWIEPNMMETLHRLSVQYQAELSVCGIYYDRHGQSSVKPGAVSSEACMEGKSALRFLHLRKGIHAFMWNKLYLTEKARTIVFPYGNFLGEDYCALVPWLENVGVVAVTDRPLYHYVIQDVSNSKCGFGPIQRKGYEQYAALYHSFQQNHSNRDCEDMANYLCVEYSAIFVAMIRNQNFDQNIIESIRSFLKQHLRAYMKSQNQLHYLISVILIAWCPKLFQKLYTIFVRYARV